MTPYFVAPPFSVEVLLRKSQGKKNTLNKLLFCTSGNIIANTDIFSNEMAVCAVGSFKTEITKIA
jgi:hypothetical protein